MYTFYHVCERDDKSTFLSGSFGVVKFCSLRWECRRGWEGRLKNGVRMKHLITVD